MKHYNGRLLVNGLDPAQGLVVTDDIRPTFTYMAGPKGIAVSHMALEVYDGNDKQLWANGIIEAHNPHIQYAGKTLHPKTAYRVKLILLDGEEVLETVSVGFETGFLGSSWQAGWIEPVQQPALPEKRIRFDELFRPGVDDGRVIERLRPCPMLRRVFTCDSLPQAARLYASAHGLYEMTLNGQRVGERLFAPESSPYPERLYYQTYDVASLLRQGENLLEVVMADGWWAGRIGISGDSCQYGDRLGFIMQLEMRGVDGMSRVLCSDAAFESRISHVDYADLFVGERHDYTRTLQPWQGVVCAEYSTTNLVAQPVAPVGVYETLAPSFFQTPKGELMADFGQVTAGVVELELNLDTPATVTLDFCEVLDSEGNFFRNIIGRNKNQQDVVVCSAGRTTFSPRFTYHGFRYVRIDGAKRGDIVRMRALCMGTHLQGSGGFDCSDEAINRLQRNILASTRSNMLSVPTDCPQREKMGWTGDIQMFVKTAAFNYDMSNFLTGWLANMRSEQTEEGEIPCVVPCYPLQDAMEREKSGHNSSPGWGDACILVPLYLYQNGGDIRLLRDNLPMMEGWLGFIKATAAQRPDAWDTMTDAQKARNPYLWTKGHQFGDWLIPSLREGGHESIMRGVAATYEVVGSCFYAVTVRAFLAVLHALRDDAPSAGLDERIAHYAELLETIRQAVREEYIAPDGSIKGDLQGQYVMALYAGIGDEALRRRMAARLVSLIAQSGGRLDTGFVATPYLLDVLCETGHRDAAFRLLFQKECPSWLYMVERGATTIWENWAAIRPDGQPTNSSYNHYALGCVGDWLYRNAGGIAPLSPGYQRVRFAPMFELPMDGVQAYHDCPYGRVMARWRKEDGHIHLTVTLPERTSGEVLLPIPDAQALLAYDGPEKENSLKTVADGEAIRFALGAGTHSFTF